VGAIRQDQRDFRIAFYFSPSRMGIPKIFLSRFATLKTLEDYNININKLTLQPQWIIPLIYKISPFVKVNIRQKCNVPCVGIINSWAV